MSIETPPLMSTDDLLALPEDGVERELIRGELREGPMTRGNFRYTRTEANIVAILKDWVRHQPQPPGIVLSGEAGFRIARNPDTIVGIDVAYISADTARANPVDASPIEGVPVLAVEILSPSDKQEEILEKVGEYLKAGVALVWIVEPVFKTVSVYRPGAEPMLFNAQQELSGEAHLPGFRAAVRDVFGS
jgi:Uma2 family endonuclease